ncbi:MAG: hypothetical protein ABIH47_07760 [Candidatus Omnitrophota bacterium]
MRSCVFIVFIGIASFAQWCWAETLYFKKNEPLIGTIVEETDEKVLLAMEGGCVLFLKSEIDHIDRQPIVEVTKPHDVRTGEVVIPEQKKSALEQWETTQYFNELYYEWSRVNERTMRAWHKVRGVQRALTRQARQFFTEFTKFNEAYEITNNEMKKKWIGPATYVPRAYRRELGQLEKAFNAYHKAEVLVDELSMYDEEIYNGLQQLQRLEGKIAQELSRLHTDRLITDQQTFQTLTKKHDHIRNKFSERYTERLDAAEALIVPVVINGRKKARLRVNDSASFVTLSLSYAKSNGIVTEEMTNRYRWANRTPAFGDNLQLPDALEGERVNLQLLEQIHPYRVPIILNSVRVGDAVVRSVPALISNDAGFSGADGVLGRSFLRHFVMTVDKNAGQIMLEKVRYD